MSGRILLLRGEDEFGSWPVFPAIRHGRFGGLFSTGSGRTPEELAERDGESIGGCPACRGISRRRSRVTIKR
jgi:hypothetical protein